MKQHSKHKKGQAQKDTKQVILLKKNHMQKKQTLLGSGRKDPTITKVSSLSRVLPCGRVGHFSAKSPYKTNNKENSGVKRNKKE